MGHIWFREEGMYPKCTKCGAVSYYQDPQPDWLVGNKLSWLFEAMPKANTEQYFNEWTRDHRNPNPAVLRTCEEVIILKVMDS